MKKVLHPGDLWKAAHMPKEKKHKAKLGTGARFAALKAKLTGKKGVTNPGGLAAHIGRKKYGPKKFAKLSAKGKIKSKKKPMEEEEKGETKDNELKEKKRKHCSK